MRIGLRRQLNTFDVTNLVVGSIIGADIYVAAALGSRLVGPASLLLWVFAGIIAIIIALSFSYCAAILPRVGGPYSYVKEVAGSFNGFMVGWSLLLAEWVSLAVFPVAFTQYLQYFIPGLDGNMQAVIKGIFVILMLLTNVFGVKLAGKFNDILTIGKLSPLLLLMVAGLIFVGLNPIGTFSNFQPFIKGDLHNIGQALVLIFWAYAGFELSTLPADEIQKPRRTIPKAIVLGMGIVTIFYLTTNFVIIGVLGQNILSSSSTPLIDTAIRIFNSQSFLAIIGAWIIGVGALISIMGADESGTIGTSRLAFAMSLDGLLPKIFSRLHRSYHTPYLGLILLCLTAFIASVIGTLTILINTSVFLLSFTYFSTCASTIFLEKKHPRTLKNLKGKNIIPIFGIIFSIILMTQVTIQQIITSFILLCVGIPLYIFFSPKKEIHELREDFLSKEAILARAFHQERRFLAYVLNQIKLLIYSVKNIERAWVEPEDSDKLRRD